MYRLQELDYLFQSGGRQKVPPGGGLRVEQLENRRGQHSCPPQERIPFRIVLGWQIFVLGRHLTEEIH